MEIKYIHIKIARKNIVYLDSIIGAYEGIAVTRTTDAKKGHVELAVPSYFYEEITWILKDLSRHWFPIKIQNNP